MKPLLAALRREPLPRPPVWLMRQAGRYLPEYQEVRKRSGGFLAMARTPELAAEVTLQPVRRFGVDAAILFSDILLPLAAMGLELEFRDGVGPVFPQPLTEVDVLSAIEPAEELAFVGDALKLVKAELPDGCAMLGFAGGPYTLASYAVPDLRRMMYHQTETYARLMNVLADVVGRHLAYQIEAGADAVVLFDTWAGQLTRGDYGRYVLPWSTRVLDMARGAPRVHFVRDGGHLLGDMAGAGPEALALDWRVDIADAFERFGDRFALQGNLDPAQLLAPPQEVSRLTRALLARVGGRPGHVLSLGHGVLKQTDPECVAAFVETVKSVAPVGAP